MYHYEQLKLDANCLTLDAPARIAVPVRSWTDVHQ
ncbi:hypothetical protein BXY41_101100 [Lacrimispora xylanisolvens]|uniref:Uncharacterized protein n=1 Tax=Lacrimispora xylanisolvens TaxID=384636 RepID=A0A2S6HY10_9FIRM|nr:hypothetical protein BXY41_101100 [Hungatella xylanolytica]